jgi:hypothetical protein
MVMKRKVVHVLFILTTAVFGLASVWLVLPDIYSFHSELVLAQKDSWPDDWKLIEEPKWGIRFRVPPDLKEREQGNLWIHENDSLKVIVDFGAEGVGAYISEKVRLKTIGFEKNYAQKIMTHNGLKTLICSYEKSAGVIDETYSRVLELIYLENRGYPGPSREPVYRVEYKIKHDHQIAMQILQSVTFFSE